MTISAALGVVHARIERASHDCGRDPAEVKLIAVSKGMGPECVRQAYAAGQRAFGENYAQELVAKAEALADLVDLQWHFIGHLQSNKARVVVRYAHFVHTVDSVPLARELGRRAIKERDSTLPVLIEVNIGGEPQKAGATPGDIAEVMAAIRSESALELRGLMSVPPAQGPDAARRIFEVLRTLRNLHGGPQALPDLSMGMSDDLEDAIERGATFVRVGTAIFGPRPPRGR